MKRFCPQGHDTLTVGRTKYKACKICSRQRTKEWAKNHRAEMNAANKRWHTLHWKQYREKHIARIQESARKQEWKGVLNTFGKQFTSQDYTAVHCLQEGRCANKSCGRIANLHMDHDHKTMRFRGLLCQGCNRALGMCQDNVDKLIGLANYLNNQEVAHEETNVHQEAGC